MPYTVSQKPWQFYVQNLLQHTVVDSLHPSVTLVPDLATYCRQPSHPNHQLPPLLPVNRQLRLGSSLKRCLTLIPWLLLPYATTTQALLASTAQTIQGTPPYLTFDGGTTKVTTTDSLLSITLSNSTQFTPSSNTSTATNPIVLPNAGERFSDISMMVPIATNSITLNALIGAPYNYWGDDDGDGQGKNAIIATGSLSLNITDKFNQTVNRNEVLSICKAPYKVELTSTDGSLITQYGIPNSSTFTGSRVTYYINPKSSATVCYAKPNLKLGTVVTDKRGTWNYAGPANIWDSDKGFITQSMTPTSYSRNFPTTGANKMDFDLEVGGAGVLHWPVVTKGGVTATMTPDASGTSVHVVLTGPEATADQWQSSSPGAISKPALPQTFELVGYDKSNKPVVKYGFVLKQWFVHRGNKRDSVANITSWCDSIGYHVPRVKDITNAVCVNAVSGDFCEAAEGGIPSSTGNMYQRQIGAGFFSEWGYITRYSDAGFVGTYYWTRDVQSSTNQYAIYSTQGRIRSYIFNHNHFGMCVSH